MANAVEQALLLHKDMAELWLMRRHEVFLSLRRYLGMVCFPLDPFYFPSSLIPFLTPFSFFGRLFKPPFEQRRLPATTIGR